MARLPLQLWTGEAGTSPGLGVQADIVPAQKVEFSFLADDS